MANISKLIVSIDATIKDAMEVIDKNSQQIALVVDSQTKLIGTITDGDIRRAILKGYSLNNPISDITNRHPTVGYFNQSKDEVLSLALQKRLKHIPIVDENGVVISLELIEDFLKTKSKPNRVVLMAGGLGVRLRPLTENTPKPMLKIGDKPILQTIIENFVKYGFNHFYISVNYKSHQIKEYFGDGSRFGANIEYIDETKRLGTAGAISLIKDRLKEPFFVMNGDLLTNLNFDYMLNYHLASSASATMAVREYDFQIPYGVINTDNNKILSIEEKPIQKFFINSGIYLLNPEIIENIPLDTFFDMPDLFNLLIKNGENVLSFQIREYWLDIGKMQDFERATIEYSEVFE
jgi:dTDP-glucose pyrophosphorylase